MAEMKKTLLLLLLRSSEGTVLPAPPVGVHDTENADDPNPNDDQPAIENIAEQVPKQIDILAEKGPKRDLSIQKGPKDRFSSRFSALFYTRILSNGDEYDRDWLVYSKELDKVLCFSCKIFNKGHRKGNLATAGFNGRAHLSERLREHETSADHVLNMAAWYDLRNRLQKDQTIDKFAQQQLEKEKEHRRKVLFRKVAIVKFLGKHNLAFCGHNSKIPWQT
uniref:TTF-type domain-containing protein n=1 Tax=Oryza brachyantha TaxID=4533 RepID=J3MKD3_ORYBR